MNKNEEIGHLREREKELRCIYFVDNVLNSHLPRNEMFKRLVNEISTGWQYPGICSVKISVNNEQYLSPNFQESSNKLSETIVAGQKKKGVIEVYYSESEYYFLKEEKELLSAISNRIGNYLFHNMIAEAIEEKDTVGSAIQWEWMDKMAQRLADRTPFVDFGI